MFISYFRVKRDNKKQDQKNVDEPQVMVIM